MNEQIIRLRCLELANEYSHSIGDLIGNADVLVNFVDGIDDGCGCGDHCEPDESVNTTPSDINEPEVANDDAEEMPAEVKAAFDNLVGRLQAKGAKGEVIVHRVTI
jgi:hypothetical protein